MSSCEGGEEPSGSMKDREFLAYGRTYTNIAASQRRFHLSDVTCVVIEHKTCLLFVLFISSAVLMIYGSSDSAQI
jgi:hypothetical protein